jgi:2-desacetyl-2-hydroxyethyl bacteriochlorophyllide A dehydrogenase
MNRLPGRRLAVCFSAPRQAETVAEALPPPGPDEVTVAALLSAISAGSELLVYRGQAPSDLPVDDTIEALGGGFGFPIRYGYSLVGQVAALGSQVDPAWLGRQVFAFHPHASHFNARPEHLIPLPPGIPPEEAVFLPNMETAVSLLMDGRPLIGEQVAVFGQGIVGLLTTSLLARFPLASLLTLDAYPARREASLASGATASLDPAAPDALAQMRQALGAEGRYAGADLVYELSGSPAALDQAIAAAGFAGRVVIGSWYGAKPASLSLGGRFHRARLSLVSSQVSSLAPELSGRWDKPRRLETAWQSLRRARPSRFVTQRFPVQQAGQAYRLLDTHPETAIQVLLTYDPIAD